MCSIQEEGVAFPAKRDVNSGVTGRRCMKCDNQACVVIRMNDAMCRDCFVSYVTHKFRSAFGKSRVVRDHDNVLVGYSGGPASTALTHLIQEGLSKRAHKKLRFVPTLVFIDESVALGDHEDDIRAATDSIVNRMKDSGVQFYVYNIEQVMQLDGVRGFGAASPGGACLPARLSGPGAQGPPVGGGGGFDGARAFDVTADEARSRVKALFKSAKTLTAKEKLLRILRSKLLAHLATQHGMDKVLVGESASRLAVRLLAGITEGRGANVPGDITFADQRLGEVSFIRPLRDFTAKEVALYVSLQHLEPVCLPTLATKTPHLASLERLTEGFVAGLQADFPNTTNTIMRTGEKFCAAPPCGNNQDTCCLCGCILDTDVEDSSALNATKFSHSLCQQIAARNNKTNVPGGPTPDTSNMVVPDPTSAAPGANPDPTRTAPGVNPDATPSVREVSPGGCGGSGDGVCDGGPAMAATPGECCGQGDGGCHTAKGLTREDLERHLCFACRVLVRDISEIRHLPPDVQDEARHRSRREDMRAAIQDCLLEDD